MGREIGMEGNSRNDVPRIKARGWAAPTGLAHASASKRYAISL